MASDIYSSPIEYLPTGNEVRYCLEHSFTSLNSFFVVFASLQYLLNAQSFFPNSIICSTTSWPWILATSHQVQCLSHRKTSSQPVYGFTWFIMKGKCSLICFLLSLIEEQLWVEDYGQHNPAVPGNYPAAAENHAVLLPEQPSYCEGMLKYNLIPY